MMVLSRTANLATMIEGDALVEQHNQRTILGSTTTAPTVDQAHRGPPPGNPKKPAAPAPPLVTPPAKRVKGKGNGAMGDYSGPEMVNGLHACNRKRFALCDRFNSSGGLRLAWPWHQLRLRLEENAPVRQMSAANAWCNLLWNDAEEQEELQRQQARNAGGQGEREQVTSHKVTPQPGTQDMVRSLYTSEGIKDPSLQHYSSAASAFLAAKAHGNWRGAASQHRAAREHSCTVTSTLTRRSSHFSCVTAGSKTSFCSAEGFTKPRGSAENVENLRYEVSTATGIEGQRYAKGSSIVTFGYNFSVGYASIYEVARDGAWFGMYYASWGQVGRQGLGTCSGLCLSGTTSSTSSSTCASSFIFDNGSGCLFGHRG